MNKKLLLGAAFAFIIVVVLTMAFAVKVIRSSQAETTEEQVNSIEVPDNLTTEAVQTTEAGPNTTGAINPLTGKVANADLTNRRPIVVMLDNQYYARPQAALSEADIIYEILAEGQITRYMAVFYGNYPDHVGPVRSSRPYFVEKAFEYDPYYVHVGGSMQALSDIRKLGLADIDGLSSGAFWREKHKNAPHNMYTSSEVLVKDGNRLGYKSSVDVKFLDFYEDFTVIEGADAAKITFVYKEPVQTDKIGYFTSYIYNDAEKVYYRYTNGEPHLDEDSKVHLSCTNILVQYAKTVVLDNEGRLDVDLIASGEGKFYTAGKTINVTWQKDSAADMTRFFDQTGNEIKLNPGVTWFQVVKLGNVETIN